MWPRRPQQGSHGRKASRDQVEPLPAACPDSWPTAAPSCLAAPGPEPSAARLGCEHSGGEGAGGGERSLSAPLRVPLPWAPSSGGRAGADWTTCHPRPQRTRQGATCRLACSCGDSLSGETATSVGAGAAGSCVSPRVGLRPSAWGAWPREGGCSMRGGGGTWRTLPSALLRGAGSGNHSQGHKGPVTPTELPSEVAQEHSRLGLCSRGLTGRGGPHLAHAAGLAEGADSTHVALVPGAELRGVVVGRGVQPVAGRPVAGSLQVALATGEKERRQRPREHRYRDHVCRCPGPLPNPVPWWTSPHGNIPDRHAHGCGFISTKGAGYLQTCFETRLFIIR